MAIVKEVVATVGTYTDAQGNEKKRYLRVGSIISTRNGDMLKLDSVPLEWNGWAYLNDPKEAEGKQGGNRQSSGGQRPARSAPNDGLPQQQGGEFTDDDIPF